MTRIVVGLGNPGSKYEGTRHNVGANVVRLLRSRREAPKASREGQADVSVIEIAGQEVVLAVPRTHVNDSGRAVQGLLARHRVRDLAEVLIIVDDMELPVGTVRLRPRGSDGGHNGLKSVIQAAGGNGFPRLRVGIGRPPAGRDPIDHVLGRFTLEERQIIAEAEQRAAMVAESWVENGVKETMNLFNAAARPAAEEA